MWHSYVDFGFGYNAENTNRQRVKLKFKVTKAIEMTAKKNIECFFRI